MSKQKNRREKIQNEDNTEQQSEHRNHADEQIW